MSTQLTKPNEERAVTYKPFGAADEIKLTVAIIQNLIAVKTKSKQTCGPQDAMKFIMMCQAQRLNPFQGDAYLVGYDTNDGPKFSLITAHQAFLKRAETSPDYEGMESGIILRNGESGVTEREGDFKLPDEEVVGGWAKVFRKGRKPMYRRLSIAQRKPKYETPFWSPDKAPEQIVKCAEADALRATFPTLLGGLRIEGEIIDISTSSAPVEVNAGRLVAVKSEPDPETETPRRQEEEPPQSPDKATPQESLRDLILDAGFSFDDFKAISADVGVEGCDSMAGFEEIKNADAKRLIRSPAGLVGLLKKYKGGANE